jgi:hypothetical protein
MVLLNTFVLHDGHRSVRPLLDRLRVPHGTALPGDCASVVYWNRKGGVLQPGKAADGSFELNRMPLSDPAAFRPAQIRRRLLRHGFRIAEPEGRVRDIERIYTVPVFHLQALTVFGSMETKAAGVAVERFDADDRRPLIRRLCREAVRAVYALGLDLGVVELRPLKDGGFGVSSVDWAPNPTEPIASLYAEAIGRFDQGLAEEMNRDTPALIGMDPEFVLRRPDGKIVPASAYLPRHGPAGCDGVISRGRTIYPLAELRPAPGSEPSALMAGLLQTMRTAAMHIHDRHLAWLAGGMPHRGLPLGGHLHMSGIWLSSRLLRTLDNYLALPLVLIEDETTRRRRVRYGKLGDFRLKPHGGFEYRTLPSWIVSPRIAGGVLALAVAIAAHYRELNLRPLSADRLAEAYYQGDKAALSGCFDSLAADLVKLDAYRQYRGYIDPLLEQIHQGEPWNEQSDIRRLWKIDGSAVKPAPRS